MMKFCNCNAFRYPEKPSSMLNINDKGKVKCQNPIIDLFSGVGVTYNPLITKILDSLNKFNRIFDKKSNSNILHGYSSCSILEGEPKSMISIGGKKEETLTRICNVHSGSRTNSALSQIERDKDEKNLVPACLKALVPIKKKVAFTLTEVLLAVLIVGIIAALVLPAVVTKYQDKAFESAFNREVHSLQDSIDSLAAVENQQSFYETTLAKTPETYMKKYLRVSKYCGASGKDCFGKFYSEYSDHEKKTYTPSYDGNCAILKNGTSVCLNVNGGSIDMLIDVNGLKGPNVFGRDLRTYTHSVKGITGYDMSSNGIISLNQTPIEDDDSDPCEGKHVVVEIYLIVTLAREKLAVAVVYLLAVVHVHLVIHL